MNDLLEALDALTLPVHTRVTQDLVRTRMQPDGRPAIDPEGNPIREVRGTQTIRVEHPPLLVQLSDAIRGEMNTVAGSSESLSSTRGMLDSDALYHFARVSSMIRDWAALAHAPRRESPCDQLRAWYVQYSRAETDPAKDAFYTRIMRGWRRLIEDKLDPFDEYVHPDPCPNPECPQGFDEHTGRPTWWDPRTRSQQTDPLVIQFRRTDGAHLVEKARARCRACGTVWTVRALQYDLEQVGKTMSEISEEEPANA